MEGGATDRRFPHRGMVIFKSQILAADAYTSLEVTAVCLLFIVQVNGADVVKVGHRQVVSLIRQGGSRLLMKVVSVSRKSESNLIRKKGSFTLFDREKL